LNGDIILQPYAPNASVETRLIVKKNAKNKKYNIKEYEGKLTLFNLVYRPSYYKHKFNIPYMDHCYDCTLSHYILKEYTSKNNNKYTKMSMIKLIDYIVKEIKTYHKLEKDLHKLLKELVI